MQCSDCGQTWFQEHSSSMAQDDLVFNEVENDSPGPNEMRIPRALADRAARRVDPGVQSILQEEAALETRAREIESLESQPELGLAEAEPKADRRVRDARERVSKLRGLDSQSAPTPDATGSRRDLLPDIEEINSTLRSTSERDGVVDEDTDDTLPERRTGFWAGFLVIVLAMAILLGVYVFAPQIARVVPGTDPWLSNYVARADAVRSWLNVTLLGITDWLERTAASQQDTS